MVTLIERFPRKTVLRGWLAGGSLTEIQISESAVAQWAKEAGCDLVLIGGRKGWLKAFSDYRECFTIMSKEL
jgi:hypothetical protein